MTTSILDQLIDHPAAWRSRDFGNGKQDLCFPLTASQLTAIDTLLASTRHIAPQQVTREQFSHPALDPVLQQLFELVQHGRGVVIITGMTPDRYSEEDMERAYWGFGTHWGIAAVQSGFGEKLGHVCDDPQNPNDRGYRGSRELKPHTDSYELVGLMCLQGAASGGETQLISALAMHNEFVAHRPHLLAPLYEGFPRAPNEARGTANPVTPYSVPIFACVDGYVSCSYLRPFIDNAARHLGRPLPASLVEAMDYFDALTGREDLRMEFTLQPGDMLICNNYVTLHSRSEFKNSAEHQRHLLRLWLDIPDGRPVVPEIARLSKKYGETTTDNLTAAT